MAIMVLSLAIFAIVIVKVLLLRGTDSSDMVSKSVGRPTGEDVETQIYLRDYQCADRPICTGSGISLTVK